MLRDCRDHPFDGDEERGVGTLLERDEGPDRWEASRAFVKRKGASHPSDGLNPRYTTLPQGRVPDMPSPCTAERDDERIRPQGDSVSGQRLVFRLQHNDGLPLRAEPRRMSTSR